MSDETGQLLLELEVDLMSPAARGDSARLRAILHEEFCEFGASGRVFDRDGIVSALATEDSGRLTLRDFAVRRLADGVYLVTYRSRRERAGEVREALRSSVWVCEAGQWRMLFHQGTVAAGTADAGG